MKKTISLFLILTLLLGLWPMQILAAEETTAAEAVVTETETTA